MSLRWRDMAMRPLERDEQKSYFRWLEFVTIIALDSAAAPESLRWHVYAVPNGGSRHRFEAGRLKAEGVTPGIPDICVDVPAGAFHGMRLEMKRVGEKASPEQLAQLEHRRRMGYYDLVCQGFEESRIETTRYLARSWRVIDRWAL